MKRIRSTIDLIVTLITLIVPTIDCQLSAPYELTLGHPLALPVIANGSLSSSSSSTSPSVSSSAINADSPDLLDLGISKTKRESSSASCGSEITRSEGWIQSPNYPSNYPDSTFCVYTVHRYNHDVCRVEVRLNDFDLEDTRPYCDADYLDIGSGSRMCVSLIPDAKFITYFNVGEYKLNIIFRSDHKRTRKGFLVQIKQIPNSCGVLDDLLGGSVIPSLPRTITFGDDVSSTNNNRVGRRFNAPLTSPDTKCDTSISSYNGYIRSPLWPSDYPPNMHCVYTLRRPAINVCQVELEMISFSLASDGYTSHDDGHECSSDFLELPDRNRLCGYRKDKRTYTYPSNSDSIILIFKSDSKGSASGFNIHIRQIPFSCDIYRAPKANKCDQTINSSRYRLQSPGYPRFHGPRENCLYTIDKSSPGICGFIMDFIHFSLEPGRDKNGLCNKDYLHLPDGDRLCGNVTGRKSFIFPKTINSSMTMFFSSDNYRENSGFDILISQIPCGSTSPSSIIPDPYSPRRGLLRPPPSIQSLNPSSSPSPSPSSSSSSDPKLCNRLSNSPLDVITSPNYPSDYPPYSRCSYVIHRSSSDICQIKLQFLNLDLEKTLDCRADYLHIESTNEKFCGRQWFLPDKVIRFPYNSDNLRLNFISDGQINRPGFEIRVTQIRNSCFRPVSEDDSSGLTNANNNNVCDSSNLIKGVFRSGNYPAPYPANVNCIYRIEKYSRAVCRVSLMFSDFSVGTWERQRVCINDWLSIDGKRYCGYRRGEVMTLDFPFDQPYIDLHFKTDSVDHYGGFRIDYKQETTDCGFGSSSQSLPPPLNRRLISTGSSCTGQIFYRTSFTISTPGIDSGSYEENLDCGYLVRKASYDVCALEVQFNLFDLEESTNCIKDHLEIDGIKICGKLPSNSVRTYEFKDNELLIKFHSDSNGTGAGLLLTLKQIRC